MSDRPARPTALNVEFDAIPSYLTDQDRWVCWRYKWIEDREEWTKLPIDVSTGRAASSTDSDTWSSFTDAVSYHKDPETDTDGCGYVVTEAALVVGLDLDDCVDPETGDIDPWARETVEQVGTYWEYSPSVTGLRGFGLGFVPDGGTRADIENADGHIEMYDSGRYLTVTGHSIDESAGDVRKVNEAVRAVHEQYISTDDVETQTGEATPTPDADKSGSTNLTDAEIVEKATEAENGDKFRELWEGRTAGYPSHSEADLALCNHLAFWTGGDEKQIDRLFRDSGLYRDKWDEQRGSETYGERTISKALRGRTEYYDPQSRDTPQTQETSTGSDVTLSPSAVKVWAGLGTDGSVADLSDREKAAAVLQLIIQHEEIHVRVRRDNETLWAYDNGVWKQEGKRALRHAARKALDAKNYGKNVVTELETQALSDPRIELTAEDFGLEPGYVAVDNGLLCLDEAANRGDALRDLQPDDYALTRLPVAYDPDAAYDEWNSYVHEWAADGKADALQEYVGYCLHIGALPIHRALLLVGSGANGKSTFLDVVRALLGSDNTSSTGLQTLANEKDAVADFYGSVANIDDDLSSRKLGAGLGMFKKLTSGAEVRGRNLYADGFKFKATGKHLYAANQVPQVDVDDEDEAFWRRWLLVEFPNHYPPSDRDPALSDKLTTPECLSGVLNWAIDGWKRLLEQGHFTNEERLAHEKRTRWQAWGKSVDKYLSECVENDPDADRVTTTEAWEQYKAWCVANGYDSVGQRKFTNTLKDENVGYKKRVRIDGTPQRGYTQLGVSEEVPTPTPSDEENDPADAQQESLF